MIAENKGVHITFRNIMAVMLYERLCRKHCPGGEEIKADKEQIIYKTKGRVHYDEALFKGRHHEPGK